METAVLISEAHAALLKRDGGLARRLLMQIDADERPWLMLAKSCNLQGDTAGEEAALQRQLSLEARNLPALLLMAELKVGQHDDRAAVSFFQAALNQATATADVPAQLQPMLARGLDFIAESHRRFEAHLLEQLGRIGIARTGRTASAIDLLLGKKQLYLQQPSSFYFPGMPQRQFYERAEFDWLAEVEAAFPAMRDELQSVLAGGIDFAPYVEESANRPRAANPLLNDPSWGAFYFWRNGEKMVENAAQCPATMAALEAAPMPQIDRRSPMALWSLLRPGTHIQPHHGLLNTRLICHVPLIVADKCGLRVGNETRPWHEGEALIFDDSFEHEAWNNSGSIRVVLLFEIWRPEITVGEREALTAIFETINEYQGVPKDAG